MRTAKLNPAGDELAPVTIGFRLDEQSRLILAARSRELGVSPHELARHYVLQMLNDGNERQEIRTAMLALHQELIEARKDISVSTEALLATAGKVTPNEARTWVGQNLKID